MQTPSGASDGLLSAQPGRRGTMRVVEAAETGLDMRLARLRHTIGRHMAGVDYAADLLRYVPGSGNISYVPFFARIMYMMILRFMMCGTCGAGFGVGRMMRLSVVELRQSLAEMLNRAEYQGERIIIHRRGKDAAAIISIEHMKLLDRLIEAEEDRVDVETARASLAESDERVSYAKVRRRLGLDDEQKRTKNGTR